MEQCVSSVQVSCSVKVKSWATPAGVWVPSYSVIYFLLKLCIVLLNLSQMLHAVKSGGGSVVLG
jgi:Na+/alanine symporter